MELIAVFLFGFLFVLGGLFIYSIFKYFDYSSQLYDLKKKKEDDTE